MEIPAIATAAPVNLQGADNTMPADHGQNTPFGALLAAGFQPVQPGIVGGITASANDDAEITEMAGQITEFTDVLLESILTAREPALQSGSHAITPTPEVLPEIIAGSALPAVPLASVPLPAENPLPATGESGSRPESAAAAISAASTTGEPASSQMHRPADAAPTANIPSQNLPTQPAFSQLHMPGSVQPATQTVAPAAAHVELTMQHPGWPEAFAQRVTWTVNERLQSAQLHLNPPELGPVEVQVTLNREEASLLFVAAQGSVRNAIEQALPVLRENLLQAGIHLGNTEISNGSPQRHPENAPDQAGPQNSARIETAPEGATTTAVIARIGLVDIYA